jgi:hypothetical protein
MWGDRARIANGERLLRNSKKRIPRPSLLDMRDIRRDVQKKGPSSEEPQVGTCERRESNPDALRDRILRCARLRGSRPKAWSSRVAARSTRAIV